MVHARGDLIDGSSNGAYATLPPIVPATLPAFLVGAEFINPPATFSCRIPEGDNFAPYNGSECLMLDGSEVVECTEWDYDTAFRSTVAIEWDLVCGRAHLSPLFQSIFTAGCLLGAVLAGITANRCGRRWAVRAGSLGTVFGLGILTTAPWVELALCSRILLGVTTTLMVYPAFMMSMEVCAPRLRPTVGVMVALPYALMMMVLAGLAYVITEWRVLQVASAFPLVLLLPVLAFVDESPRWLVMQGRVGEAAAILKRAGTLNRVPLPDTDTLADILSATQKKGMAGKLNDVDATERRRTSLMGIDNISQQFICTVENCRCVVCLKKNPNKVVQLNYTNGTEANSEVSCCAGDSRGSQTGTRTIGELQNGTADTSAAAPATVTVTLGREDGFGAWWAGPVALVYTPTMRALMAALVVLWLMQGVVYLGLPLSSDSFSSPYLYMVLLGLVELPAYSLTAPITQRCGRRPVLVFSFLTCGVLLLVVLVLTLKGVHIEELNLSLVLISYLLICTGYQVNFLYTPELLPTTLRPWGTAVCNLASYTGFSIPPFITDYTQDVPWVPVAVFSACSLLAGVLISLLPETNGRPLPETVNDLQDRLAGEKLARKSKHFKNLKNDSDR